MTFKITAKEKEIILKRRKSPVISAKIEKDVRPILDSLHKKLSKGIKLAKGTLTYSSDEFPIVWAETQSVNVEKEMRGLIKIYDDTEKAEEVLKHLITIVGKKMKMYFDEELGNWRDT